jgi:hypothetical protein
VIESEVSEGLLADGDKAGALLHAQKAEEILCPGEPTDTEPYTRATCGRSLLAVGNAYLAAHDPNAGIVAYRKAESIASTLSQADPANAIFRSDWAHAQASLGGALALIGDNTAARNMFEGALNRWSILRQARALSNEDSYRADDAAQALGALRSKR